MSFTYFAIFLETPFSSVSGAYSIYYDAPGRANSPRVERDKSGTIAGLQAKKAQQITK